jgi:hypothetical protein
MDKVKQTHNTPWRRRKRRGIAPTHSWLRHYMGVSGQRHSPAKLYPRGKDPGTHWTEGWVGSGAGMDTGARGDILLHLPGIEPRSPGRPVCSQTLHWRLRRLPVVIITNKICKYAVRAPRSFVSLRRNMLVIWPSSQQMRHSHEVPSWQGSVCELPHLDGWPTSCPSAGCPCRCTTTQTVALM